MKSLPDQVFFVIRDGEPVSFVTDYDTEVFFSRDDAEAGTEEGDEVIAFTRDTDLAALRAELATANARIAELTDKLQTESYRLEDEIRENLQQRERIAALEVERDAAVAAIEAADSTLCACRHTPNRDNCNCDIHAAHVILRAAIDAARAGKAGG